MKNNILFLLLFAPFISFSQNESGIYFGINFTGSKSANPYFPINGITFSSGTAITAINANPWFGGFIGYYKKFGIFNNASIQAGIDYSLKQSSYFVSYITSSGNSDMTIAVLQMHSLQPKVSFIYNISKKIDLYVGAYTGYVFYNHKSKIDADYSPFTSSLVSKFEPGFQFGLSYQINKVSLGLGWQSCPSFTIPIIGENNSKLHTLQIFLNFKLKNK